MRFLRERLLCFVLLCFAFWRLRHLLETTRKPPIRRRSNPIYDVAGLLTHLTLEPPSQWCAPHQWRSVDLFESLETQRVAGLRHTAAGTVADLHGIPC